MGVANLATARVMRAALQDPGMFGPGLLTHSRKWSRGEEPNSQRGAKQKGKKGKEILHSEMQGQMTKKKGSVLTTPEETGIASMRKLAASSMKAPKGGVEVASEKGALPCSLPKQARKKETEDQASEIWEEHRLDGNKRPKGNVQAREGGKG